MVTWHLTILINWKAQWTVSFNCLSPTSLPSISCTFSPLEIVSLYSNWHCVVFILTCLARDSGIENVYSMLVILVWTCLNTDKVQYCMLQICFWEFLRMSVKKKKKWILVITHFGNSPQLKWHLSLYLVCLSDQRMKTTFLYLAWI